MAALKQIPSAWTFKGNFFWGGSWLQPSGKASNESSMSAKQEMFNLYFHSLSYLIHVLLIFQSFHFPQTKTVNIQYTCELVQICGRNSNQNQTLPMPCLPISSEKSSKTAATLLPFHMHSSLHPQWYGQEQPVRSDWNHGMNLAQGWDSANLQNLLYLLYMILTLWIYRERLFCPSALWLLRDIRLPTQMPQYALALGIRWNIISSTNCHCVVLPHALITWKFTQSWNSIAKVWGRTNTWKENNKWWPRTNPLGHWWPQAATRLLAK